MEDSHEYAVSDVSRTIRVEAREVLGRWSVRIWATATQEDGESEEPFVIAYDLETLDLAGLGWQSYAVLDHAIRLLSTDLRAGYE